jgi:hypothetical protein
MAYMTMRHHEFAEFIKMLDRMSRKIRSSVEHMGGTCVKIRGAGRQDTNLHLFESED